MKHLLSRTGTPHSPSCPPGDREIDKVVTSTPVLDQSAGSRSESLRVKDENGGLFMVI
jgi:hypothetical protein